LEKRKEEGNLTFLCFQEKKRARHFSGGLNSVLIAGERGGARRTEKETEADLFFTIFIQKKNLFDAENKVRTS